MSESGDAKGFVETSNMIAAIEACDSMLKTAYVSLESVTKFGGGRVCVMVSGDLASCQAAVLAGKAAAQSHGGFLLSNIIARPLEDTEMLWNGLIPNMRSRKNKEDALGGTVSIPKDLAGEESPATASRKKRKAVKSGNERKG